MKRKFLVPLFVAALACGSSAATAPDPNSHVISSAGVPANRDRLHFTADGQREMGRRYAEKMLGLMGYKAAVPAEPYVKAAPAAAPAKP